VHLLVSELRGFQNARCKDKNYLNPVFIILPQHRYLKKTLTYLRGTFMCFLWLLNPILLIIFLQNTRVNQKVKAIFKLHGNREKKEMVYCPILIMPVEEFSHVQYSALLSVEWQQRGRKHGRSFARLHHRRTTWRIAVSLDGRSELVEIHRHMLALYGQSTMS